MDISGLIVSVLIFCAVTLRNVEAAITTLRLVNLVYRHGDRSPMHSYPTNPNPNTTWPEGPGWLTPEGARMQFSLGRYLRRRYDEFLSKDYKHTEINVESSLVDRCLMSAQTNLAGLYLPENGGSNWNPDIHWTPIPVYTRPEEEDNMLALWKKCHKYDKLSHDTSNSDTVTQHMADNKEFFDFFANMTGLPPTIRSVIHVADTLFCERSHNISLPHWVNDTVFEKLQELEGFGFQIMFYTKEEAKLKGGPLLKKWLELADKKRKDDTYTTMMNMYSAHDTTVVAMLSNLGVYNGMVPPYTGCVIMELHQEQDGDYFVQLFYRNHSSQDPDDDTEPVHLTLPGCETKCPYQQFVDLTKEAVPSDWDAECENTVPGKEVPSEKVNDYKKEFTIAVAMFSVVTAVLILAVVVMCVKRSRHGESGVI